MIYHFRTYEQRITQREVHHTNFLARCQEIENADTFDALSTIELKGRLSSIQGLFKQLKVKHMKVAEAAAGRVNRIEAAGWLLPIENIYLKATAKIEEKLEQVQTAKALPTAAREAMQMGQVFRLETLRQPEVGEFDGSPAAWPAFRDLFKAEVHERELNAVTKLLYLQKACVGQARSALGPWQPLAENYEAAWRVLERKYNDSYRIKQALIDSLFNMTRCREETYDELRKVIDVTTSALRQLENMGEATQYWDMIIINVLTARIPYKTLDAWEQRRATDDEPTLDKFLEFLEGKARGKISTANTQHDRERERKREFKPMASNSQRHSTAESSDKKPRADGERNTNQRPPCKCCNGEHALFRCPKLLAKSIDERVQFINDGGLCLNCLRAHPGSCFYSGCPRCSGEKHNSILCKKVPAAPTLRSQVNVVQNGSNKRKRAE